MLPHVATAKCSHNRELLTSSHSLGYQFTLFSFQGSRKCFIALAKTFSALPGMEHDLSCGFRSNGPIRPFVSMEDLAILLIFCRRFCRRPLLCYHTTNLLSIRFLLVFRGNSCRFFLVCFPPRFWGRNYILSCPTARVNWKFFSFCCLTFSVRPLLQSQAFILVSRISYLFSGRNLILTCLLLIVNWNFHPYLFQQTSLMM